MSLNGANKITLRAHRAIYIYKCVDLRRGRELSLLNHGGSGVVQRQSVHGPVLVATEKFAEEYRGQWSLEDDDDIADADTTNVNDEEDTVNHHGNKFPVFLFLHE